MKMTPAMLIIGGLLVFWSSVFLLVFLPIFMIKQTPSEIWRPLTLEEKEGQKLYVNNGCGYCHSLFIRTNDWGIGAERIAQQGDYVDMEPVILGTERTGPDLSQEGGEHSNDWHLAHFINPRYTSPISLMPSWEFLGREKIEKLTAFVQAMGRKMADERMARQRFWREKAVAAYKAGPEENIRWIHEQVPAVWRAMPNPYPALSSNLQRGKRLYQNFCINCHGPVGDGQGPAARYLMPPPLNFTTLRRHLIGNRYIGGIIYYQVMNGITGTAMPYFKKHLESAKIWDLANYIALAFMGYTDGNIAPEGIDASYEPPWKNPFQPPRTKGPEAGTPRGRQLLPHSPWREPGGLELGEPHAGGREVDKEEPTDGNP